MSRLIEINKNSFYFPEEIRVDFPQSTAIINRAN